MKKITLVLMLLFSSFLAKSQVVVDCNTGLITVSYCYIDNDTNIFTYTSSDGTPLRLSINSGNTDTFDELSILDSDGVTQLSSSTTSGDLSGLTFQSTGASISFRIISDSIFSCASGDVTSEIKYTVACATCVNPTADYTVIDDCANGNQFLVSTDLTSLGSAASITISDNQGSTPQTVTTTGMYSFGPYSIGTDVVITVTNDTDPNCILTSSPLTRTSPCPLIIDCTVAPVTVSYCYPINDTNIFTYTSSDGSPLRLNINSGSVEDNFDELIILDSDGVTDLNSATPYGNSGDLSGLTFQSTGSSISFLIISDSASSCASGDVTPGIEYTVFCATCVNPIANYTIIDNCKNGDQFLISVDLTNIGSASSITISDDQSNPSQTTSVAGIFSFGPYPLGVDVVITVANDADPSCILTSETLTRTNPCPVTIDCSAGPVTTSYCYTNDDAILFTYTSSDGSLLDLTINSGNVENDFDELIILDSDGVTNLNTTPYGNSGDLSGLKFRSTGDTISFQVSSNDNTSCTSGEIGLEIEYTVACTNCIAPIATYSVIDDCTNGDQFLISVDLTDLGSASSVTISDNQSSTPQITTATGTFSFGPYPIGTDVVVTVVNEIDDRCKSTSDTLTRKNPCPVTIDCSASPVNVSYCYTNDDIILFTYTSSDGSKLNLNINSGNVENEFDELIILDSDGVTNLNEATPYGNNGDITGLSFQSSGDSISFQVASDDFSSCSSGGITPGIEYTIACASCVNPTATYAIIDDCTNGDQFLVAIDLTDLGSASSITISDNQSSTPQTTSITGVFSFGSYPLGTNVVITVTNDADNICRINSSNLTRTDPCPPVNGDCANATVAMVNTGHSCDLATSGTIAGALPSSVPNPSCSTNISADVWYQFTAIEETQIITFINTNTLSNLSLGYVIYEGSCDTLMEFRCIPFDPNPVSTISNLVVGTTYYIRIYSINSSPDSSFDLCIVPISTNIVTDQNTFTVEQLVEDVLIGGECAQVSNITFSTGTNFGQDNGISHFAYNGESNLFPFTEGILLSSGNINEAEGPNLGDPINAGDETWLGDSDLDALLGITSFNASSIEFDFLAFTDEISFDFLMASEEYVGNANDFECLFSDAFAFLLTDASGNTTNLAVIPGTNIPVSVTNIHEENAFCDAMNEDFFSGYTPIGFSPYSYDGRTVSLTAKSAVNVGETYHIKLVIADDRDTDRDSGVFLKAGSFDLGELDLGDNILITNGNASCINEPVIIDTQATGQDHIWFLNGIEIMGQTGSTLEVTEPGEYTAQLFFSTRCIIEDSVIIEFLPQPTVGTAEDLNSCSETQTASFILNDVNASILGGQNSSDFTVTHHETAQDAIDGINPLVSPYTNISNPQIIYSRLENNTTGCFVTTNYTLTVSAATHTATSVNISECGDQNEEAIFDLDVHNINILNGQNPSDFTLSYHTSEADANSGTDALKSPYTSSGETLYVRVVDNSSPDCFVVTNFNLIIDPAPSTSFPTDIVYEICPNETVPITITAIANNYTLADVTINWFNDGVLIPGQNNLTLPVTTQGNYNIEVTYTATGCTASESVTVTEFDACEFPQAISPNGDQWNQKFDLSSFNVQSLEIFNRYGTLVYSKIGYTDEWEGQSNQGDKLPVGIYFYIIKYQQNKVKTSWVYINK